MQPTYVKLREKRISDIITVAQKIIIENGFSDATMKEIASTLKISRPTLYKYYSNIDDIAYDIQIEVFEKMRAFVDENYSNKGNSIDKITELIDLYYVFLGSNEKDVMFTALFDAHFKNSSTQRKQQEYNDYIRKIRSFFDEIEEGQKNGDIKKELDVQTTAKIIVNMLFAILQRLALRGQSIAQEQEIDKEIIFQGVKNMIIEYLKV